jgi:hypothetical protein
MFTTNLGSVWLAHNGHAGEQSVGNQWDTLSLQKLRCRVKLFSSSHGFQVQFSVGCVLKSPIAIIHIVYLFWKEESYQENEQFPNLTNDWLWKGCISKDETVKKF